MDVTAEYFFTGSCAAGILRLPPERERWRGTHRTGVGGAIVGVPRRPMLFSWLGAERDVVGTSAVALFSNRDQEYRKSPLTEEGETTDWVWLRPEWTAEIVGEHDPRAALDEDSPFARMDGPAPTSALVALRRLTRVVEASHQPDPICLDEAGISTMRALVGAMYDRPSGWRWASRETTRRAHVNAVNDAAELIAQRFHTRLGLDEVAREVSVAPLHFCRIFRKHTGATVHTYLCRVRLAEALERLVEADATHAQVAKECGFASASHMSDTFARHAGARPSEARRLVREGLPGRLRRLG